MNSDYSFSNVEELTKRFNLDENGKMKTPMKLTVTFCDDANGYPGTVLYKKTFEVYGKKSEGVVGDPDRGEVQSPIYCFDIELGEKLRIESAWFSVYAEDTGEKQETAFAIVSDATPKDGAIIYMSEEGSLNEIVASGGAYNFCFTGDLSETLVEKGLKFMRVLGPDPDEKGRYAKVQIELRNYGKTPVSDAKLTLLDGETELATEEIDATIPNGEKFQYTFKKRIDCSGEGTHTFTVRNDTPGDGLLTPRTVSFTTSNTKGTLCKSGSTYGAAYKYITSVVCGSINNTSDWSKYSDFRDKSTDLAPGQTVQLEVKGRAQKGDYIKVWIDWNNDGSFDGADEFIGYASSKEKSEVCIWKGSSAQMYTSEQVLYSQEFTPVANGWNHIQFKEPFVITAEDDLYIGVRLTGCEELQWEIGIDNNPANLGYGDLMSYGNSPTWWSLADLGADANVLIRANVTGARTPAVDWLKLDKTSDTIAPGGEATLTVTANPWLVDKTVYDGMIRITSNDPLAKGAKIPVYLDNYDGTVNGMKFINVDADKNSLRITADRRITVDTDKHVSYMAIFTVDGRQIAMNFDTNAIDASALQYGVYAVKAVLADGTTVSGTVAVK